MCGIAGIAWTGGVSREFVVNRLSESVAAMHNRGPSSAGQVLWDVLNTDGVVAIGATRLAIQDLSEAGNQPMTTPDGRFSIVYNGEITNFIEVRTALESHGVSFRSGGDTEVLLRAWEKWERGSLNQFEGMFAFAVLDRREATLTLCRDPFGIKPLFYHHVSGVSFAFGSEMASILPLIPGKPRLNWRTAAKFLSSGYYDDDEQTFIEGIRHLLPGRTIRLDLRTGQTKTLGHTWKPSISTDTSLTHSDAVDGVRSRLLSSIKRNLRSDVPLGIALSGGIDSSAIACGVRAVAPEHPLNLFFYQSSDAKTDEVKWAKSVAANLGADLHTVLPTPAELAADIDDLILAQGEPFGSTSIYAQYRVYRLMSEQGIVVSLDGQGADEVFAGYNGFAGQRIRSLAETGNFWGASRFARKWAMWPGRSLAKAAVLAGAEVTPPWVIARVSRIAPGYSLNGVNWSALQERGVTWGWLPPEADSESLRGVRVKAELRANLRERGLQALLRNGDRNSMRFSIESRVPFLDKTLVDFVMTFPEGWLIDETGRSKAILRDAMRNLVPDEILDRRDKIGFAGDSAWLDPLRATFVSEIFEAPEIGFLDKAAVLSGIFNPSGIRSIHSDQAWRIYNLYRWAALLDVDCM